MNLTRKHLLILPATLLIVATAIVLPWWLHSRQLLEERLTTQSRLTNLLYRAADSGKMEDAVNLTNTVRRSRQLAYIFDGKKPKLYNLDKRELASYMNSALWSAVKRSNQSNPRTKIIQHFLANGANCNVTYADGLKQCCLEPAIINKVETATITMLVDEGAWLKDFNANHDSALHVAILNRRPELVRYFAKRDGSLLTERNAQGKTPLDIAKSQNDPAIMEALHSVGISAQ